MNYRRLGRTGLKVSEVSLGSWTTYGGSVDTKDAVAIIRHAFGRGINLFDTADVYVRGAAESVLGEALKGLPREQLVIATKCMGRVWDGPLGAGLSRKHIFDAVEQSLARLGVDYIDLYQLHAPDADTPIEETLRAFEDLVRAGKVRYVGFSNFDRHAPLDRRVLEHQKASGFDVMVSSQPRWNLLDRHVEEGHAALCKKWGVGMIVYSPLAQGVLSNKYAGMQKPAGSRATTKFGHFMESEQALTPDHVTAVERFAARVKELGAWTPAQVALAWLLRHGEVSSAILGATRIEQLDENLVALDVKFDDAEWRSLEAAIASGPRGGRKAAAGAKGARATAHSGKRAKGRMPARGKPGKKPGRGRRRT
jgi:aryl-alcohol dehydrogenase-like predicted oxidoreductase